ncbi:MAG: NADH:flavin oxidoreductase/NADH oxidase [Rhodospirillales bacterium]|nr:NADH:flavin oxidoreductase/NADH oxidase [Rhodospirillales bacterium]
MTSQLFTPFDLGPIRLPNRIVIAPMCQYSADDGCANDWHIAHWTNLGFSGAGLFVVEATGVERRGRITHGCLGLYSDANEDSIARCLAAARRHAGPAKFGIQIGHAGRKASSQRPWEGGKGLKPAEDAWATVAPSAVAFDEGWYPPAALDEAEMARVRDAFVAAAKRAVRIGFDAIEVHMAHGYLMHSFLSPIANKRTDAYGGSRENRMRYPLEIARAVRDAVPKSIALGARLSATDWVEGGWTIDDSVALTKELKQAGIDFLCASSGGVTNSIKVPVGPGYQVPLAQKIRAETGIATRAVGMIADPDQAELIIRQGQADMVALARAVLDNPRWGWHAADKLGAKIPYPKQYERVRASMWPGAQLARPTTLKPAA